MINALRSRDAGSKSCLVNNLVKCAIDVSNKTANQLSTASQSDNKLTQKPQAQTAQNAVNDKDQSQISLKNEQSNAKAAIVVASILQEQSFDDPIKQQQY